MGIYYSNHQCYLGSSLACLHHIDLRWCRPHQKVFPLPIKVPNILFLLFPLHYRPQIVLTFFIFSRVGGWNIFEQRCIIMLQR